MKFDPTDRRSSECWKLAHYSGHFEVDTCWTSINKGKYQEWNSRHEQFERIKVKVKYKVCVEFVRQTNQTHENIEFHRQVEFKGEKKNVNSFHHFSTAASMWHWRRGWTFQSKWNYKSIDRRWMRMINKMSFKSLSMRVFHRRLLTLSSARSHDTAAAAQRVAVCGFFPLPIQSR